MMIISLVQAHKALHSLRGAERLRVFTQRSSVQKQASTTLSYLRTWNKIQTQIAARRHSMVVEGRMKQKKHENQLKLEAKLHDLEVTATFLYHASLFFLISHCSL